VKFTRVKKGFSTYPDLTASFVERYNCVTSLILKVYSADGKLQRVKERERVVMEKRKVGTLSFIVPTYNEQENIESFIGAVQQFCKQQKYSYEIIVIDNHSNDDTFEILSKMASKDKKLKIILNSRNFGPHNSPYHAFLQATGDLVIPMVADFQTPIEIIPTFIERWKDGYDVILGIREENKSHWTKRITQKIFYALMHFQSKGASVKNFIGFGLYDQKIVQVLRTFENPIPYFRGIIQGIGFDTTQVMYAEPKRMKGKSKQTFKDKYEYTIFGVTQSGVRPILYIVNLGFIFAAISAIAALYYTIMKLTNWNAFEYGLSPTLVYLMLLGSLQFISLGLLGLYISTIFKFVEKKPLVIEERRINFTSKSQINCRS
jgi:glycosyltransferase involved in cell wall biosynthesis